MTPAHLALLLGSLPLPLPASSCPFAQEAPPVTLEWSTEPRSPYAGQTFDLTLKIRVEASSDGSELVQMFPVALDLPLQIDDVSELAGAALGDSNGMGSTTVIDGQVVALRDSMPARDDGSPAAEPADAGARVFEYTRRARVDHAGTWMLPPPSARATVARSFRDDFIRGRVPVDPESSTYRGQALEVQVLPLPEVGRPVEHEGVVGSFDLAASIPNAVVRAGETVPLTVQVLGAGALDPFAVPDLGAKGAPVRILSQRRGDTKAGVSLEYELRWDGPGLFRTPTVSLSLFDPGMVPPGYRTALAEPIAVEVLPGTPATSGSEIAAPPGNPDVPGTPAPGPPPARLFWTPLLLLGILGLAFASVVRRHNARAAFLAAQAPPRDHAEP